MIPEYLVIGLGKTGQTGCHATLDVSLLIHCIKRCSCMRSRRKGHCRDQGRGGNKSFVIH